jgi:hypothetical protein
VREPHRVERYAGQQHPAAGGVHQPGEQLRERRLAAAGLADDGDARLSGDLEVDIVQHLRPAGVRERHVLEADTDRPFGEHRAVVARVGDVGRSVEDPEDTAHPGDGVLRLVEDFRRHLDRLHEQRHQEQEPDQPSGRDVAVDAEQNTDDDHGPVGDSSRQLAEREGRRRDGLRADLRLLGPRDRIVDPLRRARLHAVRADDRRADHRLGNRTEQLADPLTDDLVRRLQRALKDPDREDQWQEAHVDQQRELPRPEQHDDSRQQHLRDRHQDEQPAPLHERAHRVHVARDAGHQRAAALRRLMQDGQVMHPPEGAYA